MKDTVIAFYKDLIFYNHSITTHPQQNNFYMHAHNSYELLYFVKGHANYSIEDVVFTLNPGDLIFIKPKNYHMLVVKPSSVPYERVNIAFNTAIVDKDIIDKLFNESSKKSLKDSSFFPEWVSRLDNYINNYTKSDQKLCIKALIVELLLYLKYHLNNNYIPAKIADPTLSKAIEYINTHINIIKGSTQVAKEIFISDSYLYLLFKKHLNVTPKNYINEKKMLKAEELIQNGIRLNLIYQSLGYEDYSSFFRAYKKYFGHAPSYTNHKKTLTPKIHTPK